MFNHSFILHSNTSTDSIDDGDARIPSPEPVDDGTRKNADRMPVRLRHPVPILYVRQHGRLDGRRQRDVEV